MSARNKYVILVEIRDVRCVTVTASSEGSAWELAEAQVMDDEPKLCEAGFTFEAIECVGAV